VSACARFAAGLHWSAVPVGAPRSLGDEIDRARAAVTALAPLAPALAESLHAHLAAVDGAAAASPGPPVVAHGDFRPSQVLFDGPTTGLVDFDTMCRAEPALDLGQFTGHLAAAGGTARAAVGAVGDGPADLGSAFLREYLRLTGTGDPEALLARVAAYRTVMLARLAVRRWCQLKPQGVRPVLSLLDRPPRPPQLRSVTLGPREDSID
jgi:aminoglycoside phosphotransferase (APT) family kinase protein